MNIKELYDLDYSLLEKVDWENESTLIIKEPVLVNDEWDIKLTKKSYLFNLNWLNSLVRDLANETYDKYWSDNLYVVRWAGHKETDIVNCLVDLQLAEEDNWTVYDSLTDEEKIELYNIIIELAKEKKEELESKIKE